MYGSKVKAEGILSFLSDRNAFRITRSQQTLNDFPTILKMKIRKKGGTSMGEIIVKRVHY